ncbi:MAG: DoxX family protein [Rhizobiaceae bacterium]|jgi:putative oxidoreductase|nr:DoxX family protein [Rhizobiaceae bacterium]
MITRLIRLHGGVFGAVERTTQHWLPGLAARFAFAAVLSGYYFSSFLTKIGPGVLGPFTVADNAYYQIVPLVIEAAGYDAANVALVPWKLIVWFGTYAELVLPLLVVAGLFTRLASLGMIGFIIVQSLVDVFQHKIGAEATGAWFDRAPDAAILDQRLLWVTILLFLVIKGAGLISLDAMLARRAGPA